MSIRQVQLVYNEEQYHLLLRFATADQAQFRFWLTRRFVKQWWGLLTKMLAWDGMVIQQSTPPAKQAMVAFQHERHTADADFKQPFANSATSFPLGDVPVIIGKVNATRQENGMVKMSLLPVQGAGIDIVVDAKLLHLLVKLLQDAVGRSDWDIRLPIAPQVPVTPDDASAPRTLN